MLDGGEPIGLGQLVAVLVLVPRLDDPVGLVLVVGDDQDWDGEQPGLDRAMA